MKLSLLTATVILGVIAVDASVATSKQKLPSEFSYSIYVQGKPVGKSDTKVTQTADGYIFESQTSITGPQFNLEVTSRTEVDGETMLPRMFRYKGNKGPQVLEGEALFTETEVSGYIVENEQAYPYSRQSKFPNILLLEDFVMSNEVLIAAAFALQDEDPAQFGLLFPSASRMTIVQISKGSDVALESETEEAVCGKLVVSIQGSAAFVSYFDPKRNLPVYLAFPETATEVFLYDFFKDEPVSRYRAKPDSTHGHE
jgi:hypothetical protein